MPPPTEREIVLVSAYLRAGSTKAAASELGIHSRTYRHRLSRVYRRHGVSNMAQLVFVLRAELDRCADASLSEAGAHADD